MAWEPPNPALVWKAIEIYLSHAYEHSPSAAVRQRLDSLRATPDETFFACGAFEATPKEEPTRLDLRLGNRFYPHMKMVIERAPDGRQCLFRADTHDRHIQPAPGSRDYAAFRQLMERNHAIGSQIEAAWESQGVPTFKSYLREDLERRRREAAGAAPNR
jgi:hypothetical protein